MESSNTGAIRLCRKLLNVLVDVLAHAANLNSWAAAYDFYVKQDLKNKPVRRNTREEKFKAFAERYINILGVIDEAKMFLEKQ